MPSIFFVGRWINEHVAREEAVPGQFSDYAYWNPMFCVRAHITILNEQVFALDETLQTIEEFAELVRAERTVMLSPPNILLRRTLLDDVLVVW
jgi:hypothetical protein